MDPKIPTISIPRFYFVVLNNLYEIDRKLAVHGDQGHVQRNIDRIRDEFQQLGLLIEDPMGEPFKDTRTDLEATIAGPGTEDLVVTEVIKPIIRANVGAISRVVQQGIVVVQTKEKD